jgi:YVTN family beta-propeller protein
MNLPLTLPMVARGLAASFAWLTCAVALGASPAPLTVEAKIPLGSVHGRIDHLAVDVKRQRLYVAELGNDTVGVIDLKERKVAKTLTGLKEPQGIGYEPTTDTVYVANARDGSVRLFSGAELSPMGQISLGDDADNVRVEEQAHRVWVGYGGGALATIDIATRKKVGEIALRGHPESFRLESPGTRIFVNVPDAGEITVVDRAAGKIIDHWKTNELRSNYPLALDDADQVLSVFRHPAKLAVFRKSDGHLVQSLDTCGDSDDLFVDAMRHRVYVTCGEGFIEVFARGPRGYQTSGRLATSGGARTSLFVPELDRLFLAVRATLTAPAALWVIRPES